MKKAKTPEPQVAVQAVTGEKVFLSRVSQFFSYNQRNMLVDIIRNAAKEAGKQPSDVAVPMTVSMGSWNMHRGKGKGDFRVDLDFLCELIASGNLSLNSQFRKDSEGKKLSPAAAAEKFRSVVAPAEQAVSAAALSL